MTKMEQIFIKTTKEIIRPFIDELRKLIDAAIRSWTRIDPAKK